jgi:NAD+ synthase (glutamine-hydrolysing)
MKNIAGLKISLCQMKVVPGRPDLNAGHMISEIEKAEKRKVDVIAFPEMCVPGYFIGDKWEDEAFVSDVAKNNDAICAATKNKTVAVIFGSLTYGSGRVGEDGRLRKFNTWIIAQFGEKVGEGIKTLQPNYRMFDDDRHFFSVRKNREEFLERSVKRSRELNGAEIGGTDISEYFAPVELMTRAGLIKVGTILCEDMWHQDYQYNPTKYLVDNGAEIIFNLSASPWGWQKNRKRHEVVKELLSECKVPFVYVNNTGIQNNGKNIIVFDGSSTVYNKNGNRIFEVSPYENESCDFVFKNNARALRKAVQDDTRELYLAALCAIRENFLTLDPAKRRAVIGLSGGADSALDAALLVDALGRENVFAYTMPSQYTSEKTLKMAKQIAKNLSMKIEEVPIQEMIDVDARITKCEPDSLAYENLQARIRMHILATKAQQLGCVFIGNCNKVETAFGYGTMYGDIAGFMLPIGDLVKREVYELMNYMNKNVFKKQVIPKECFTMAPTAELKKDQKDPFDYGNLNQRGYHDELVRAFTDFRKNPEWVLDLYVQGKLEEVFMLEDGHLRKIFPKDEDFIKDLERCWSMFNISVFKRVQAPPIPIFSKRAFGYDLRESILPTAFTARYGELKKSILVRREGKARIALYGGSFNPVCIHHRQIAEILLKLFDVVFVIPCGKRSDKKSTNIIDLDHRKKIVELGFSHVQGLKFDFHDLDQKAYTPTYILQEHYEQLYPEAEIWHVTGTDLIAGGRQGKAEIQTVWTMGDYIWKNLNWLVILRPGYVIKKDDLPPKAEVIEIKNIFGSGTLVRERIAVGKPIDKLVLPEVAEYIKRFNLYK